MALDRHYIMVTTASLAAQANAAAAQVDILGGDQTFTVPLARPAAPTTIVAYWCDWWMSTADALSIRNFLQNRGFTVAETTPVPYGTTPASTRLAIFDRSAGWEPDQVLAVLGLATLPGAEAR